MNVIYESLNYLPLYTESDLSNTDFARFFSTHKKTCIFVTDEQGVLKGYIDHRHYKECFSKGVPATQTFPITVELSKLPEMNLKEIFSSCEAIPVLDHGTLIGAFLKNYSEELTAFDRLTNKIALNALQSFKQEVVGYLHSKSISTISFIGDEEDRQKLKEAIADGITVLEEGDFTDQLTLDTLHSKSYRRPNGGIPTYSMEELLAIILIPVVKDYCQKRCIQILIYEGPHPEKLHTADDHGLLPGQGSKLEDALTDPDVCKKFSAGNSTVFNFLKDSSNGPLRDNYVTANGLHLMMGINNRDSENTLGNNVHLYGSCLTYGMCVPEQFSISEMMKPKLAKMGYGVINHGVKNGHSLLNDLLYLLNTPLKTNDKVVIINAFPEKVIEILNSVFTIRELSETLNQHNDLPWHFLDNTFHVNHIANQIIADEICKSITPPEGRHGERLEIRSYMEEMSEKPKPNERCVYEEWVLGSYKEYLLCHKRHKENATVGSVLLTANPLTFGHQHLIQYARAHCDMLYVFIVEEDLFFFTTAERMLLARMCIADPDIVVVSTGSMMTARFTFPEYFAKSMADYEITQEDIPDIHCEIFGQFVGPLLGITVRFVGEEEQDCVTKAYNQKLHTILPTYGIDVVEIPRLRSAESSVISSSSVRKAIEDKEFEKIKDLVPKPVERYIQEKWNR